MSKVNKVKFLLRWGNEKEKISSATIVTEKTISEDKEFAETLNNFLIFPSLKITPTQKYKVMVGNDNEPILNYIDKLGNYPSINFLKSRKKEVQTFIFKYVSYEEFVNEIKNLRTTMITAKLYLNKKF